MTTALAIACGEVPWERDVLAAVGRNAELEVARRYVDVAGIERDLSAGRLPPLIVMSPALRGFAEKPVRTIATAARVLVLVDSIHPPWLATTGLDCRPVEGLDLAEFVQDLAAIALAKPVVSAEAQDAAGPVTLFMGVSGGVGTSSLAHLHARSVAGALLVEGDSLRPSLGFLLGRAAATGMADALHDDVTDDDLLRMAGSARVLSLAPGEVEGILPTDVVRLVDRLARSSSEVVVDGGSDSPLLEALVARCDRLVVVTAATPLGIVRVCSLGSRLQRPAGGVAIIANRARDSAVGASRWMNLVRNLIERETGIDPVFVADDVAAFARAWLDGDWRTLDGAVPRMMFTHS